MSIVNILAIETSCDETSASICSDGEILSNIIATQKIHAQYGGVVPELASRAHIQQIIPVIDSALSTAGISKKDLNAVAFTHSPGLIGALLVGAEVAKSLALCLDIPLIKVHHMQAHVLANLIGTKTPKFPFLCLTVSGGHTQIDGVYSEKSDKESMRLELEQARIEDLSERDIAKEIKRLEKQMLEFARNLEFEAAASARDQLNRLRALTFGASPRDSL